MDKKDIILRFFFDENGNSRKLLKNFLYNQVLGDHLLGKEYMTNQEYLTIMHQFIESKYIKSNETEFIPLEKLEEIFTIGGFAKKEEIIKKQELERQSDLQRQRDNVEASIKLASSTKIIGAATLLVLIVQCVLFWLQIKEMKEQSKFLKQQISKPSNMGADRNNYKASSTPFLIKGKESK